MTFFPKRALAIFFLKIRVRHLKILQPILQFFPMDKGNTTTGILPIFCILLPYSTHCRFEASSYFNYVTTCAIVFVKHSRTFFPFSPRFPATSVGVRYLGYFLFEPVLHSLPLAFNFRKIVIHIIELYMTFIFIKYLQKNLCMLNIQKAYQCFVNDETNFFFNFNLFTFLIKK